MNFLLNYEWNIPCKLDSVLPKLISAAHCFNSKWLCYTRTHILRKVLLWKFYALPQFVQADTFQKPNVYFPAEMIICFRYNTSFPTVWSRFTQNQKRKDPNFHSIWFVIFTVKHCKILLTCRQETWLMQRKLCQKQSKILEPKVIYPAIPQHWAHHQPPQTWFCCFFCPFWSKNAWTISSDIDTPRQIMIYRQNPNMIPSLHPHLPNNIPSVPQQTPVVIILLHICWKESKRVPFT